jgi:hypothetical protein
MRVAGPSLAIALLLVGCAPGAQTPERLDKSGYNRRELRPDTPGLLTGPDGVWTIYSRGGGAKSTAVAPREECTASDARASVAPDGTCPAPAKPARTVLLPKP